MAEPEACALCGFNCIGGGFYTQCLDDLGRMVVIHTIACGPVFLGDTQMSAPTHELRLGAIIHLGAPDA